VEINKLKGELLVKQMQSLQAGNQSFDTLLRELRTHRQRAREALSTIRSNMRLELSEEKSRQRDLFNKTTLSFLSFRNALSEDVGSARMTGGRIANELIIAIVGYLMTTCAAIFSFLRVVSKS